MGISLDEQPEKSKRKRDGGKPSPALVAPETIAFGSPSLVVDKATKDTDSVSTSAIVQEKSDNARPTSCFTPSAKASVPDKAASFADNNESPPNTQSPSTCGHQNAAASIEEALRKTTKSERNPLPRLTTLNLRGFLERRTQRLLTRWRFKMLL